MLQAPTNDRKTQNESRSNSVQPLLEQEQFTNQSSQVDRSHLHQFAPKQNDLAALQKAYGNQAVLRMSKGMGHTSNLSPAGTSRGEEFEAQTASGVHDVLNSPGQPLDAPTSTFMENRFGRNLSQVRLHTDRKASESAKDINAAAYTFGSHIVFDHQYYAPNTKNGQRLLAHELTHVLQQASAPYRQPNLSAKEPFNRYEQEANFLANQVTSSKPMSQLTPSSLGGQIIQRQEVGEAEQPTPTDIPFTSIEGATPLTAPTLPTTFSFTVSTGLRSFPNVFRSPSSGNFSITASAVMSRFPSTVSSYWIQPVTSGFHLNGDEKEFRTGVGNVTQSWSDIAGDVNCALRISTANTNPTNALTGTGTVSP